MISTSARYRPPFTATQWQELEHQALIYKYMSLGVPIPPDLLYTLNTSLDSRSLAQQPIGWRGCFQTGFGRKIDTEPGRCRRTDGKKWRCSKEAHPDSKYCEKHMHRGKTRSRKLVEVSSSNSSPKLSPSFQRNFSTKSVTASPYTLHSASSMANINTQIHPSLSSSKPLSHHMFLDSGNSCSQDDKYFRGMDERVFLEEASGSARNCMSDSYEQPLTMSSYYSQSEISRQQQQQQQQQSCFVWGTDFKSSTTPFKAEK